MEISPKEIAVTVRGAVNRLKRIEAVTDIEQVSTGHSTKGFQFKAYGNGDVFRITVEKVS